MTFVMNVCMHFHLSIADPRIGTYNYIREGGGTGISVTDSSLFYSGCLLCTTLVRRWRARVAILRGDRTGVAFCFLHGGAKKYFCISSFGAATAAAYVVLHVFIV